MDTGKVLLGVLAGIATGALLGVLFAPDKGSKTRKKIYREGEEITDDLKEKFDEIIESIEDKFQKVKKDVSDFAEKDLKTAKQ